MTCVETGAGQSFVPIPKCLITASEGAQQERRGYGLSALVRHPVVGAGLASDSRNVTK